MWIRPKQTRTKQSDINKYTNDYNNAVSNQRRAQNDVYDVEVKATQISSAITNINSQISSIQGQIGDNQKQTDILITQKTDL